MPVGSDRSGGYEDSLEYGEGAGSAAPGASKAYEALVVAQGPHKASEEPVLQEKRPRRWIRRGIAVGGAAVIVGAGVGAYVAISDEGDDEGAAVEDCAESPGEDEGRLTYYPRAVYLGRVPQICPDETATRDGARAEAPAAVDDSASEALAAFTKYRFRLLDAPGEPGYTFTSGMLDPAGNAPHGWYPCWPAGRILSNDALVLAANGQGASSLTFGNDRLQGHCEITYPGIPLRIDNGNVVEVGSEKASSITDIRGSVAPAADGSGDELTITVRSTGVRECIEDPYPPLSCSGAQTVTATFEGTGHITSSEGAASATGTMTFEIGCEGTGTQAWQYWIGTPDAGSPNGGPSNCGWNSTVAPPLKGTVQFLVTFEG